MSASEAGPADSLEESTSEGDYTLLALLGERPQVLTLLLWALTERRNEYPKRIIVLTTAHGERHLRVQLLGDKAYEDGTIRNAGNHRWESFCRQVLGSDPFNPDQDIEVPEDEGSRIEDVDNETDEQLFTSWCYDLVRSLTHKIEGPLYGCMAGGRKTMASDITTAFSLYGHRDHKLFHVIVPKHLEKKETFFWPRAGSRFAKFAGDVNLVEKPFLHLHMRLDDLLRNVDGVDKRSHYAELLGELAPDRQALATPKKVTLRLQKAPDEVNRRSDSTLSVWDETEEPMVEKRLTVKPLATLLFLWDYLWKPGERRCLRRSLLKSETADKYRRIVYEAFYDRSPIPGKEYEPWNPDNEYYDDDSDDDDSDDDDSDDDDSNTYESEYSDSTSPLKRQVLAKEAVLKHYFYFHTVPRDARSDICGHEDAAYAFKGPLPEDIELNIEVSQDEHDDLRPLTTALTEQDPFRHFLPKLTVVDS